MIKRLIPVLVVLAVVSIAQAAAPRDLPNIVIILADDLGYGDPGCYNADSKIPTPNIDRFAAGAMRFTDGHSASGICSPSRYTLLTGRYHWRTRLQRGIVGLWERPLIAPDRMTIASMLKQRGYRTAAIGKWHLGWDWPIEPDERFAFKRFKHNAQVNDKLRAAWHDVFTRPIAGGPTARGFDTYFGTDVPNWPPYCHIENNRTLGIPSEYLPPHLFKGHQASQQGPALKGWTLEPILPTLGERAVESIIDLAKRDEPYFLYLPLTVPHTPLAVNDAFKDKSGLSVYGDFVMETDAVIGQVLDAIDASGEADRTLVMFTSDNGCAPYIGAAEMETKGHHPSGPLRGYKGDTWEGGHRVPLIIRYPGVTRPGSVTDALAGQVDFVATIAEIVGFDLPPGAGEDSVSLMPVLRDPDKSTRDSLICQGGNGLLSIRRGRWKLIAGPGSGGFWSKPPGNDKQPGQLYNLAEDLPETQNRFDAEPTLAIELTALLKEQVESGRSTPGPPQKNDVPVKWNRLKKP